MIHRRKLTLGFIAAISIACSFSCKKVVDGSGGNGNSGNNAYYGNYTFSHSLYDSLYMYAKAFYLWNSDLPTFEKFDPVGYKNGDSLTGLKNELYALTQIPVNPETGKPYEYEAAYPNDSKYSYMLLTSNNTGGGNSSFFIKPNTESFTLDGYGNDLGIHFGFTNPYAVNSAGDYILDSNGDRTFNTDTVITVLKYVDNGSPAEKAGLKRGDIVYKMNGKATGWSDLSGTDAKTAYYNGILDGSNLDIVTIDSLHPKSGNWKETENMLTKKQYTLDPIILDSVINLPGGKKVGYMVLEGFTQLSNAKTYIDAALKKFANVTDLVVDLRYNGGGAVETSQYLANALVTSGHDGDTLFTLHYNDSLRDASTYSSFLKTVLKSQTVHNPDGSVEGTALDIDYSVAGIGNHALVAKSGSLTTSSNRIFFIVGGGTASASELLINALKPYNNIYLVGAWYDEDSETDGNGYTQIRTYGKPVGFFDLRLGAYTIYMSMFRSLNANDEGDYYNGMLTNGLGSDDVLADFGKSEESYESLNLVLQALDATYKVPGSSSRAALHNNISIRKIGRGGNLRASLKSYQDQENLRNFKPMVRKVFKLK